VLPPVFSSPYTEPKKSTAMMIEKIDEFLDPLD
jgi:hypothetical protein